VPNCDLQSALTPFIFAVVAGARYAIGKRLGFLSVQRDRFSSALDDGDDSRSLLGGRALYLDRDEEPERFGFWQGVYLTICLICLFWTLISLDCV